MHVMLIEDDPLVREMVLDSLAEDGMTVEGLASARTRWCCSAPGQVPDVLVADIDLGAGLTGTDLAAIARERHPEVAVVLISGAIPADKARVISRRDRLLRKPFSPERLGQVIREAAAEVGAAARG
jgi:DNA-binding NtrC family response regulator